jgi:probable phosphoglycerate mutase
LDATRIIAIRHGETAWNVDTRIQGHLDIPLNDTGRGRRSAWPQALAGEPIAAVYASDLQRAHTTAGAIARLTGREVVAAHRPARTQLWHVRRQDLRRDRSDLARPRQAWRKRVPDWAPEGGESLLRCASASSRRPRRRWPSATRASRSCWWRMAACWTCCTAWPPARKLQAPRTWQLGNGAINRLLWTPQGFTLVGWSDTQHLDHETR